MTPKQAVKVFENAIATVKRFGVRVTRESEFGTERNGEWHSKEGHVCACGALVLALNPNVPKRTLLNSDRVIDGVRKILGIKEAEAWAISEGFEGDRLGGQRKFDQSTSTQRWYAVGKSLRRHGEKVD